MKTCSFSSQALDAGLVIPYACHVRIILVQLLTLSLHPQPCFCQTAAPSANNRQSVDTSCRPCAWPHLSGMQPASLCQVQHTGAWKQHVVDH